MICPNCETENSVYATECYRCGFPLGGKPRGKRHRVVALIIFALIAGIVLLSLPLMSKQTDVWLVKIKRPYFIFMAEQYYSMNQFSTSVDFYSRAIDLGESSPRLYAKRGHAYFQLKEYDRALEDYSQAILADPRNGRYRLYRGKTYLMLNQKAAARKDLNEAAQTGILEAQAILLKMTNDNQE